MDTTLPVTEPAVHIYTAALQGVAAVQATGTDGEQYCVVDSGVIVDDPDAREYARCVYLKAMEVGR